MYRVLFAVFLSVSSVSCAHVQTCGQQAIVDIEDTVRSVLPFDDYESKLDNLVTKYGMCVVRGAVAIVLDDFNRAAGNASVDATVSASVAHGESWMKAHR